MQRALDAISDELYRAERGGAEGDAAASPRGAAERRADALVEMAKRAMAATDAAASGNEVEPAVPLVMVTMDVDVYGNVFARLADETPLSEGDALRLACDAALVRVLCRGASVPVDLGRATRTPSRARRRAMAAMWANCAHPSCDRPFAWCELHHIHHWILGGPTDLDNLVPLCSSHHHLHHKGVFGIRRRADGRVELTYPDGTLIGNANPTTRDLLEPLSDVRPAA